MNLTNISVTKPEETIVAADSPINTKTSGGLGKDAPPGVKAPCRSLRNVLSNWGAFLVSAIAAFFLSPFIVQSLGDAAYGAWVLLVSLVGYMGLFDLGVRGAVTRFVANFHAQGDHTRSGRVASTALVVFLCTAAISITASAIAAVFVVDAFTIPPELIGVARAVFVIGGITIAISLIGGVFEGIVVGMQRFDYTSGLIIFSEVLRVLLVLIALSYDGGLLSLAVIQLSLSALRCALAYWFSRKLYPQLKIKLSNWERQSFGLIFSFSFYFLLLQASGQIVMYSNAVVISTFLPIGLLTYFSIANNLADYARTFLGGFHHIITPMTSAMGAKGEIANLQATVMKSARIGTLLVLPIIITFFFRGESFIALWMGPRYAKPAWDILFVLSFSLWTQGVYAILVSTMLGLNRHKGLVPFFLFEAVANLGLSIWFVRDYGLVGVAWATTIPRLIVALAVGSWYGRKIIGRGLAYIWFDALVRPTLFMIPFALASYAMEQFWPALNMVTFFAQVGITLPLAGVFAWYFCLTSDERTAFIATLLTNFKRGRLAVE